MRFDVAFRAACECCKADGADVPEVEATIRLLLLMMLGVWRARFEDLTREAERVLASRNFSSLAQRDDALASYVTRLESIAATPLPAGVRQRVEQAARELALVAAQRFDLPAVPSQLARDILAAEHLQLMVEEATKRAITSSLDAARAVLDAPTGPGSEEAQQAARTALRQSLDAEQAIRAAVDSWSYHGLNTSTIRAAAADGHRFIQMVAKIDTATTAFCRLVNGRVVPIDVALAQINRIEQAVRSGDPAALVRAAPFVTHPRNSTQAEVDAVLAAGGIAPFHFGCRTQNVPIRLTGA